MATPSTSPDPADPAAAAPARPAPEPQHFLQRIKLFSALSPDECQQVVKRMKRATSRPTR